MEHGAGLKLKFDPRGRTYEAKDFRKMSDKELFNKVIGLVDYLPWKNPNIRHDLIAHLCVAGEWFEEAKSEPQEERRAAA